LNSDYFENKCIQASKGVAQKNMSTEWLKEYEIPLYSSEKQTEIEDILDRLSLIIEYRKEELNRLDELIKARFIELFGDESNPKNWEVINIEEVADVQVGVVIKPAQYYTDEANGIKAFRSLNIGGGYIKDSDWVYFSEEGQRKNSKSILKENDLLIVRSGAPGTSCVVTKEYEGCNAIDIIIAHPNCDRVNPYYLCMYTNMPHGKKQIDEGTGGAAQQHFNVGKYNKMKLMLPPLNRQNEFVEFVKQVNKSKIAVQKALEGTQLLFDSLMQKYFG
jgi:type I restriction enzyme S subunit